MNARRLTARLGIPAALALLALAGCGTSAKPFSPACGTAIAAARYITGTDGAQDPANDFTVIGDLAAARWHTPAELAAAKRVEHDLNPDITVQGTYPDGITGGAESIAEGPQLDRDASALLGACKASPAH